MIGDVQVNDLKACLEVRIKKFNQRQSHSHTHSFGNSQLFTLNHASLISMTSSLLPLGLSTLTPLLSSLSIRLTGQTKSQARLNAVASYDQSNALFRAFLSKEMMYSCALWGDEEGGPRGDLETANGTMKIKVPTPDLGLEAAQLRKIHHVLKRARCHKLPPGSRLLEFGTGWGGLAIQAALTYPNLHVTSLTLSTEQKALAEARAKAAGVHDRVTVHLMDYREMPSEWEASFDTFVSVEMVEHVGTKVCVFSLRVLFRNRSVWLIPVISIMRRTSA
jgi:cyclopropane-fatty-acyl-phospholipid synthase